MSKPDEVPQDVWDVSIKLADGCYRAFSPIGGARAIAKAILAAKAEEREVCAVIAQGYSGSGMVVGGSTGSAHQTKRDIADAIRKRGEG